MLTDLQKVCKEKGGFIFWRLPGKKQIFFTSGIFQKISEIPKSNGFVIQNWNGQKYILTTGEISITTLPEISQLLPPELWKEEISIALESNKSFSKEEYIKICEESIEEISKKNLSKVVLSRISKEAGTQDISNTFRKILGQNPDAFCYFLFQHDIGCWLGATPEKLMDIHLNKAEIHALAGSTPASNIDWSEKEFNEQSLVSDHILKSLESLAIKEFEISKIETVNAGPVSHLRTTYSIDLDEDKIESLLSTIHPTPAICGTPRDKAMELIRAKEIHDRRLYCGFLGSIGPDLGTHLFVNLRCMNISHDESHVYVGGGITIQSDPEKEWNETLLKAQTMQQALTQTP